MILFFDKNTKEIIGTINGRCHPKHEMDMWIGENTDRYVVQWVKREDKYIPLTDFVDFFIKIDNKEINILDYKIKLEGNRVSGFEKK